jgi:hypothetical protein
MAHQSKAVTEQWQSPLLSDRLGLRQQHDSGRLSGGFINNQFVQDGHWKPTKKTAKRRDSFEDYGGEGDQKVGPGWDDLATTTRADGIGEIELVINGIRWVEINGTWVKEEEAKKASR